MRIICINLNRSPRRCASMAARGERCTHHDTYCLSSIAHAAPPSVAALLNASEHRRLRMRYSKPSAQPRRAGGFRQPRVGQILVR
jgi:hypothetical protein